MKRLFCCAALAMLFAGGKAFALGVDVGPVHIHGTKVKVGSTVEFKIIVDKIVTDDDEKDRVKRIKGHRVNSDEKFEIKVSQSDLDDRSREILKNLKTDRTYEMKLERASEDWKLQKVRKDD